MKKLILFTSLSLLAALSQPVFSQSPVFTGCPPFVEGGYCDSLVYQVVAIDPSGDDYGRNIRYHLVSGPGQVNEKTGLWVFHPDPAEADPYLINTVEIAASAGQDTTSGDENCTFGVRIRNESPRFESFCGAHFTVLPDDTLRLPLNVHDPDGCDPVVLKISEVTPEVQGTLTLDAATGLLTFVPASADSGMTFTVTLEATDGVNVRSCRLYFDTYPLSPVQLQIETSLGASVGDTVQVAILMNASPVEFGLIDLVVSYNPRLLDFLGASGGPAFFSETEGCSWEYFRFSEQIVSDPGFPERLVRIRGVAESRGHPPHALCYLPEVLPAEFASLEFAVRDAATPHVGITPIRFFWADCRSNLLFSPNGQIAYYSSVVYDLLGYPITQDSVVVGYDGAADVCYLSYPGYRERYRQVEFYNGGISLKGGGPPAPYVVRIEHEAGPYGHGVIQGMPVTLDVTLESIDAGHGLGGFSFLIAYNSVALTLQRVDSGQIYEDCGWEYFSYRHGPFDNCGDGCPNGMVQVVGVAEINNGSHHPGCADPTPYVDGLPVTLAELVFMVTNDRNWENAFIPVRFFWTQCSDNRLSSADGLWSFASRRVFDWDGYLLPLDTAFPTYGGEVPGCGWVEYPGPYSLIDFYGGGVDIIGCDMDILGDINCNGIQYEIADAVLFMEYFKNGLDAFGLFADYSVDASDINRDGTPLSVADLVQLLRIIIGDVVPDHIVKPSPHTASFNPDPITKVVIVDTRDTLAAVHLVFEGEEHIVPGPGVRGFDFISVYDGEVTRVLMSPPISDLYASHFDGGVLVRFSGDGALISADASTQGGRMVPCVIGGYTAVDEAGSDGLP